MRLIDACGGACGRFVLHTLKQPFTAPPMSVQSCPVEVLDKIFEYTAYSDPRNAQAALYSLMLTCLHFRVIAKRHFIRVACLPNAGKINLFFDWLKRLLESGDYGKAVLPIQHLAVAGEGRYYRRRNDAEAKAEGDLHLIITTAAPSLLTLTILDMDHNRPSIYSGWHYVTPVPDDTAFPKLRDLIVLKQGIIHLVLEDDNKKPDKRACQLRYPTLRRLYTPGLDGGALPSALPYLEDLRLLDEKYIGPPPREELSHVRSIIIDVPKDSSLSLLDDFNGYLGNDVYDIRFCEYQTLIEMVGNPKRNGVVVPTSGSLLYPERDLILSAWADAVVGGKGCWTTAWAPTTTRIYHYRGEKNVCIIA